MAQDFLYQMYRDLALSITCQKYWGNLIAAKPLLLICICDAIKQGLVKNNRIRLEVIENLYHIYQEKLKVTTPFNYPFYFLESESFYHLRWKAEKIVTKAPSMAMLRQNIEYAYLDNALWDMLQDLEICDKFRNSIEDHYLK